MSRQARVVIPGEPHHITHRGNNKKNIFFDENDFVSYCFIFNKYSKKYNVDVLAYCLMPNHVHFVLVPNNKDSFGKLFRECQMMYSRYFNYKYSAVGHLWQGRFFSRVLDGENLFYTIRYVEQNPVRAKIIKNAWDYLWSSAKWHTGSKSNKYIYVKDVDFIDKFNWREVLDL